MDLLSGDRWQRRCPPRCHARRGSCGCGSAQPCTRSSGVSQRVVVLVSVGAHRGDRVTAGLGLPVANGPVLHPTVASDAPGPRGRPLTFSLPDSYLKGIRSQVGVQARGGLPANDSSEVDVRHESHVHPATYGAHVGTGTSCLRGMSATYSSFCLKALKCLLTRSTGHCSRGALCVVGGDLAQRMPSRPCPA